MPRSLLFFLAITGLVLATVGCDAVGSEDTVILNNANSDRGSRPTVEYTFAYDTNGDRSIEVPSEQSDDLGSILSNAGFSRANIVSATVDSVRLERLSSKTIRDRAYVFDYLTGATVYLGSDATGTRIAEAIFDTTDRTVLLQVATRDVTDVIKNGSTPAFLQLDTDNDVPDRQDRVSVTVYYEIEVGGV